VTDRLRARLRQWIATLADGPAWLLDAGRAMHAWRNPVRLVRLLRTWESERPRALPGEDAAYESLRAWAISDRERWAEQEARRMRSLRRRRDKYRIFAADLASRYVTIVTEKLDLRKMSVHAPVGEDVAENETARASRVMAAVGELRGHVIQAARARGAVVAEVGAAYTTLTCPSCGVVEDRGADRHVVLRCADCGYEWDQDREGAPLVMLAAWRERPGDAKILVAAREDRIAAEAVRKSGEMWSRARRMAASKRERIGAARKPAGNSGE
jgi:hypothetical protein